jgi:hypothetical protein
MHRTVPLVALLAVACAGAGNADIAPCPDRAAELERRLAEVLVQVQPWNEAGAAPGPVVSSALAAVTMPFHRSDTTTAIYLTSEGRRVVGDQSLEPGRAAMCGALSLPTPDPAATPGADAPVFRAHIAATAKASEAAELLVDFRTCGGHRVDLVFRRDPQPEVAPAAEEQPPTPGECPGNEEVLAVLLEKTPLPEAFLTVLPLRLSPEVGRPFQIEQGERWERAAQRLAEAVGSTEPPVSMWFESAGALAPMDDPSVLLQAPWTPAPSPED